MRTLETLVNLPRSCRTDALPIYGVALLCFVFTACVSESDSEGIVVEDNMLPGFSADHLLELEGYVSDNNKPSGQWREEDGAIVCDGYMTRYSDQDYCAAEVPEDWVPFELDGQQLYIQPLAHAEGQ